MRLKDSDHPLQQRVRVNGVELSFFEWHRELRGRHAPVLFTHATGFHARVWDQTIRRLGDRYAVAVDQRGHGRSEKVPIEHWRDFGEDLAALVRELDLRDIIGVGHSMGGHALTDAARACADRFRRLILIDPVIFSPEAYDDSDWMVGLTGDDAHPTARRKRSFDSVEEMFERFRHRAPYSAFDPAALHDYCEYGLVRADDGEGYSLACPPELEASVYMTSRTNGAVYESIRALDIPVTILRAKEPPPERDMMDFASSPTWPGLVHEFKRGREVYLADHSHFIPMEAPDLVAGYVLESDSGGS